MLASHDRRADRWHGCPEKRGVDGGVALVGVNERGHSIPPRDVIAIPNSIVWTVQLRRGNHSYSIYLICSLFVARESIIDRGHNQRVTECGRPLPRPRHRT